MRWRPPVFVLLGLGLAGCSSSSDTHPLESPAPKYDADAVAKAAMTQFDKDGNGGLDAGELAACPALLSGFAAVDTNKDRKLSADEIVKRVEAAFRSAAS
jgi:hypothetical protein